MNEFISGELGWKGEPGDSAYDISVKHGYTGTEAEWADSFLNADNYYTKSETYSKAETYTKAESDAAFATQDVATTSAKGLLSAADKTTINTLTDISAAANQGHMRIGDLGVEWGTVEVTSGPDLTPATTFYSGSTAINFYYTYSKAPSISTQIVGSYTNCLTTFFYLSSETGCTVGMRMTSANSTRSVGYLVIGKVAS